MQRGMDRSDPEVVECYLESTIMERRKKSDQFPQEVLDLCEKEDLEAYDQQIDDEEEDNEDEEEKAQKQKRKSLIEKLLESRKTYNLRNKTTEGGDESRLEAEEPMDTN